MIANPFGPAKNNQKKATICFAEEWSGLYIDGKLLLEDSTLKPIDILRVLGYDIQIKDIDQAWVESKGGFPNSILELPKKE